MQNRAYRVAVDIGTSKVSVMIAGTSDTGKPERLALTTVACEGMSVGKVESIQAVGRAARKALTMAEQEAGLRVNSAYFNISNDQLRSFNKSDSVFKHDSMQVISAASLKDALEIASSSDLEQGEEALHITPKHYVIDGSQLMRKPLGVHASQMEIASNIIAAKKEDLANLRSVAREMGIKVERIIANHMASARACLSSSELERECILIDIGGGTSDIAVFREGLPEYAVTLGLGGNLCTSDLHIALGIPMHEAEQLKIEHGSVLPEAQSVTDKIEIRPESMDEAVELSKREIAQLLKDRMQEVFQLIERRVDQPEVSERPITNVVFTGGATELNDFLRLAKYVLQRGIRTATPIQIAGLEEGDLTPANSNVVGMILWAADNLSAPQNMVERAAADKPITPRKRSFWSKIWRRS